MEYTVALVEYTSRYHPYKKACDTLEELMTEREEDERRAEIDQDAENKEKEKARKGFENHSPNRNIKETRQNYKILVKNVTRLV